MARTFRSVFFALPPPHALAHLVQVTYLVGEVVKLFDEKGLLPQGYEGKVGLGFVRLRGKEGGTTGRGATRETQADETARKLISNRSWTQI